MPEPISMREAYGKELVSLGGANENVVVLSADVQTSDYSHLFGQAFPERFFNVGIAEQCLVDVAVGLSYAGRIPFVNTFAVFIASRALEPVLTHLCYGRANVKLMAGFSGLSGHLEGPTHHAITDVAVMRSLPGMTVVSPADNEALRQLLPQVAEWPGPVYFRFVRTDVPVVYDETTSLVIGKAAHLRDGGDLTLIANGTLLSRCLAAADSLHDDGLEARVLDLHTVKPIDVETILDAARETGAIVTAEEHTVIGGLGGAVAEVVTSAGLSVPVVRVGLADRFAESGQYVELLDKFGMSTADIVVAARHAVNLKRASTAGAIVRGVA